MNQGITATDINLFRKYRGQLSEFIKLEQILSVNSKEFYDFLELFKKCFRL